MSDWSEAATWITFFIAVLIYSLYKLKHANDPKDELLKAKKLLDEGLIAEKDYEIIKNKLLKRIVSE